MKDANVLSFTVFRFHFCEQTIWFAHSLCEEKATKSLTLKFKEIFEKMNQGKNEKKSLKNIYLHKTCSTTWVDAGWPTPLLAVQMYVPPLWRSILSMSKTGEDNFSSPVKLLKMIKKKKQPHMISIITIVDRYWIGLLFILFKNYVT